MTLHYAGFPQLLKTFEKPGIYFGSLNPGNSLEICVKTLNPFENCERHKKIDQHILFWSLNFILFYHQQPLFRKIIDTSLECCINKNKS